MSASASPTSASSPCPCAGGCNCGGAIPPGLSTIPWRRDFDEVRRALLRARPGETAIAGWHPVTGDLGLQVLEWWAYLADVLGFYNERILNESYLRTAVQPSSVANLVALLGYAPSPGVAASGQVALLRSNARPSEPLAVPAQMQVGSVPTPGVAAQVFEVAAAASFSGPSSLPLTLAPGPSLVLGSGGEPQSVLLGGTVSGTKSGDELVLAASPFSGAGGPAQWAVVTVGSLAPQTDPSSGARNTLVSFASGSFDPAASGATGQAPNAYRLLRASASAPLWNQDLADDPACVITGGSAVVHLAATVRSISPGDTVLLDGGAAGAALAVVGAVSDAYYVVENPQQVTVPVTNTDVDSPSSAGSTSLSGGTYTLTGGGTDIWTDPSSSTPWDQFQLAYWPLQGDGSIVARVTSFGAAGAGATINGWAKAGLIFKQSTTPGDPYALICITPDNGTVLQWDFDESVGGAGYSSGSAWLRLTRTGDYFAGFLSADGSSWSPIGAASANLASAALVGLFVTAHDSDASSAASATAVFDNVSVTAAGPQVPVPHSALSLQVAPADVTVVEQLCAAP
ncbi:MAG TPA: hypothetical protein VMD59_06805, partial [Acidimicrobiales bacterium]|nr:hypothetical protein [Acidimicrobiales bacterium]